MPGIRNVLSVRSARAMLGDEPHTPTGQEEEPLGRILRQPQAVRRANEALNRSYAFVVSRDFGETAVMIDGELRLFDEPEAIDYPWNLPVSEAGLTEAQLSALDLSSKVKAAGLIDVDEDAGRVKTSFNRELSRDLGLSYKPENWTEAKLAAWFCRQVHDPTITHASKRAFVAAWLGDLLSRDEFELARANRQKFQLRNLLEARVHALRTEAAQNACGEFLFGEGRDQRVRIGSEYQFEFHPDAYAPTRDDNHEYGDHTFDKHYYPRIGAFDSKEEYQCACWLDRHADVDFWVRNLVGKPGCSFFFQKGNCRFFPDFVCKLTNGRILVVEYKGGDRYVSAADDRLIGNLWAELSGGTCGFVMVTNKEWEYLEQAIKNLEGEPS
ncbi:MAG: hypothetical protein PF795_15425 [Kiritimatiellae bacterium]|nr:hypothetical protein [Kiritimatiellia bacterium]